MARIFPRGMYENDDDYNQQRNLSGGLFVAATQAPVGGPTRRPASTYWPLIEQLARTAGVTLTAAQKAAFENAYDNPTAEMRGSPLTHALRVLDTELAGVRPAGPELIVQPTEDRQRCGVFRASYGGQQAVILTSMATTPGGVLRREFHLVEVNTQDRFTGENRMQAEINHYIANRLGGRAERVGGVFTSLAEAENHVFNVCTNGVVAPGHHFQP